MAAETIRLRAEAAKVDESMGLVFGYAIVCKMDGKDYYDLQGHHIPEDVMTKAAADFMVNSRVAKVMHDGDEVGNIVFAFPLSEDVAKALDIEVKKTGLLVAMKPDAETLQKFKNGDLTGFSIGGVIVEKEDA